MRDSSTKHRSALALIRLFLADRGDQDLAAALADRAVRSLPPVAGNTVLDLGCGPGLYARAMANNGATVVSLEIDPSELLREAPSLPPRPVVGDGGVLPFDDASFDAVLCSNMLEHTPHPLDVIDEIGRVLRPGAWAYLSWTNWLSPWGGHAIAPLHYLGATRGERVYRRLFGDPKGKNLPFDGVWPLHIGDVLTHLRDSGALAIETVEPRYYPWARPVMSVPGVREVLAWNCVIMLRRVPGHDRDLRPVGEGTPRA